MRLAKIMPEILDHLVESLVRSRGDRLFDKLGLPPVSMYGD